MYKILLIMLVFLSCQLSPDKASYPTEECFYSADCLYRAGKANTVCDKLTESCRDAMKEKRNYERLTFCSKTEFGPGFDAEKCRLYINQK